MSSDNITAKLTEQESCKLWKHRLILSDSLGTIHEMPQSE